MKVIPNEEKTSKITTSIHMYLSALLFIIVYFGAVFHISGLYFAI